MKSFKQHAAVVAKSARIIGVALAIGAASAASPAKAAGAPQPAGAAAEEIKIVSTEFKFGQPTGRAAAGRPVTLVLDNSAGETEHVIFFPALDLRVFAKAGEIVRKTVVFDKAGDLAFVCDLPGHREAGMEGKLAVGAGAGLGMRMAGK